MHATCYACQSASVVILGSLMMRRMMKTVQAILADEAGLETVEYAIITGLIVSGTIASVTFIGSWVSDQFGNMADTLTASTGQ